LILIGTTNDAAKRANALLAEHDRLTAFILGLSKRTFHEAASEAPLPVSRIVDALLVALGYQRRPSNIRHRHDRDRHGGGAIVEFLELFVKNPNQVRA
jgi:hypothetical protein